VDVPFFFSKILGLEAPWTIEKIELEPDQKRLDIHISFKRGATFFYKDPETENEGNYKAYDTRDKTWRHLNLFDHECYLHARLPRIKTKDGQVRMISPPWTGLVPGFTLLFEALILQLCKNMPVHQVAKLINTTDYKIWTMLDKYVALARANQDFSEVSAVGVDETSEAKGHNYISLFVDLVKKRTMFIADGKDNTTVSAFKNDLEAHSGKAENIKDVSCDMSPAFIKGVKEQLPNAKITFDKFHILKIINKGVDEVRREEAKKNPILKGCRYVFLKNEKNLTATQKENKEKLLLSGLNLKSMRALNIRESFQQIYRAESFETFELLLKRWYYWASHSHLPPMKKAAKTIKNHWAGILRWKESQINNGILEGLNSIVQAAKRKARGYKTEHMKTIAYLITGGLDFKRINSYLPT
jgi:transposase